MIIYSTCSIFLSFSSCLTLYKNLHATANFLTSNKVHGAVYRFRHVFRSIWHCRGIPWWYLCGVILQKSTSISCWHFLWLMFCTNSIRSIVTLSHYSQYYNWILPVHHHEISRQRGEQNLYTWNRTKLRIRKVFKNVTLSNIINKQSLYIKQLGFKVMLGAWGHLRDSAFENSDPLDVPKIQSEKVQLSFWHTQWVLVFRLMGMGITRGVDRQGKYCLRDLSVVLY